MPFIINGQKVNKPIYKGIILNAVHVWLQNHWTGTPNASISTLSQDGKVVATNLFPNPGFAANGLQPTTKKNITSSSMSDGVLTFTRVSGTYSNFFLWWLIGLPAGTSMVASCATTNGVLAVWSSSWNTLNPSSFTVPDDGAIQFAFKSTSDSAATFTQPLLCTAADWQAMQARGVTWFDGTTYTRSSINN